MAKDISKQLRAALMRAKAGTRKGTHISLYEIGLRAGVGQASLFRFLEDDPKKHRDLTLVSAARICQVLGFELTQQEGVDLKPSEEKKRERCTNPDCGHIWYTTSENPRCSKCRTVVKKKA